MGHYDCKECHRDPVSGHAQDCSRGKAMAKLIRMDADLYDVPLDSGFTPANIEDAEWLVANMPGNRRFHEMQTYERALICHTVARFRLRTAAALIAAGDRLSGFAVHDDDCQIVTDGVWSDPIPCTCGFTEAWRAWRDATEGRK